MKNSPWDPSISEDPKQELYVAVTKTNYPSTFLTLEEALEFLDHMNQGKGSVGIIHKYDTNIVYFNMPKDC